METMPLVKMRVRLSLLACETQNSQVYIIVVHDAALRCDPDECLHHGQNSFAAAAISPHYVAADSGRAN